MMHGELFGFHKLNAEGQQKAARIAEIFDQTLVELDSVCMDGRSFDLAKAKLEEACFYSKKAMALDLTNQDHSEMVF